MIYFAPKEGRRIRARLPFDGCDYVLVAGSCPSCGTIFGGSLPSVFKVQGKPGSMTREHDRYKSTAVCVECNAVIGQLVVIVDTIFGIEEDEIMSNGGHHGIARVY